MKYFLSLLTLMGAFSAYSAELQLQECKFKNLTIDFIPSSALTAMLSKEVKGSIVYKVKYKQGQLATGPKTNLAVIDELPGKNLEVTFFEHDNEDGIVYSGNSLSIDLKSPVATDAPLILFSANMSDAKATKGRCGFTL
jgi:hypothetical protein